MRWLQPEAWASAVAVSAALAIWGKDPSRRIVHYIFKPLTVMLVIAAVVVLPGKDPGAPRIWFLVALGLSLIGDILLMLSKRYFVPGLVSFLMALLTYAGAMLSQGTLTLLLLPYLAAVALICFGIMHWLWPQLGRHQLPVLAYIIAMSIMVSAAASRLHAPEVSATSAGWAMAGAALFMLGDTLLASRRFAKRAAPYALELGVYFAAQWCLGSAVWS